VVLQIMSYSECDDMHIMMPFCPYIMAAVSSNLFSTKRI
jgi:hypothetical protein